MAKGLGIGVLSMRLEAEVKLSAQISSLGRKGSTKGLEVVWWQKVEPVGLILGGNLDL